MLELNCRRVAGKMASQVKLPSEARNKYNLGHELARGHYSVVYTCTSKERNSPYALKVMLKKGNKKDNVMSEVNILKKVKHPGILRITDFMECDKEYILVTELLNGGELFDFVLEKEYLDEKTAAYYIKQTLDALNYLHKNNIIHLDLKPENIVLKDKECDIIKIIDFGAAQDLDINPKPRGLIGTPEFIAPEVLNLEPASFASDMWAIGIITFVLLSGMSPFLGEDDMETMSNISTGEFEFPDPYIDDGYEMSEKAKSFIGDLLLLNPSERTDGEGCLKHDWMTNANSKLVGTERLKSFRARRRWLAITRAARLSISLSRMIRGSSSSTSTSTDCGSPGIGPDDALEP